MTKLDKLSNMFVNKTDLLEEVTDLKTKVNNLKSANKSLRKEKEEFTDRTEAIRREYENYKYTLITTTERKEIEQDNKNLKFKNIEVERADERIREVRIKFDDRVKKLADELIVAKGGAEYANAKMMALESEDSAYKQQVADYKAIITELTKLLPKVDMSKFNVNVDVPQKDINVNCN